MLYFQALEPMLLRITEVRWESQHVWGACVHDRVCVRACMYMCVWFCLSYFCWSSSFICALFALSFEKQEPHLAFGYGGMLHEDYPTTMLFGTQHLPPHFNKKVIQCKKKKNE